MPDSFIFTVSQRRKHPALRINEAGKLEFLAPVGFPIEHARRLIEKNPDVISRLRERHEKRRPVRREWCDGMRVYWYGKLIPVHFTERAHAVTGDALYVPRGDEKKVRAGLAKIYRTEALEYLTERTAFLARKFGVSCRSVGIGSAGSRWGSCSRDGRLRYSWKLIQCDVELIDYVIIHELAHRKVFDHSFLFWQEVSRMNARYEELRKQLRHFSKKVELL